MKLKKLENGLILELKKASKALNMSTYQGLTVLKFKKLEKFKKF